MANVRVLVVDDSAAMRALFCDILDNAKGVTVCGTAKNADEARTQLEALKPDVLTLDVEMPGMSGLELLESNRNLPRVVLVTSKEHYAARAFEFNVAHYLVKPVDYTRFLSAVDRIQEMTSTTNEIPANPMDYIFIKENGVLHKVPYNELMYVEALGDYMKVHTKGRSFTTYSTMKNLEEKLCAHSAFIRVHRSFIINIGFLDNIDNEAATIKGHVVPIGSKYRLQLQQRLHIL